MFLKSIRLDGFLSFPPGSPAIELEPLNVLIGPNGSGKSNLIEAVELLHATPTAFAQAIRSGGGVAEWLWKGTRSGTDPTATIEAVTTGSGTIPDLRYHLTFAANGQRTEILDESINDSAFPFPSSELFVGKFDLSDSEIIEKYIGHDSYYWFGQGHPLLTVKTKTGNREYWMMKPEDLKSEESILSQRKDPYAYPELTWLGQQFARIQTFREWSFGRTTALRQPQPADLPSDSLLPDSRNLGLVLNELEFNNAGVELNRMLGRFLPRFERILTRIQGSTVQVYVQEEGLRAPIPMSRLSDGTIRFIALLALLLTPTPPPLLCIEEPELGLHPDAVGLLAGLLVDASTRTQLIVTTHSDALVSGLSDQARSVMVCESNGGTRIERVDPEKLSHWLDRYRLGEIWRIGELGGNP